jgi:hypothetical protein
MKRKYCCDASRGQYVDYYINQAGSGLPIFQGSRGQRGHGFGSVLGGLFRSAMPMLKRIGAQALRTGAHIASDMASGKSFGESASKRISEGINTFLPSDPTSIQSGSGVRKSHKRKSQKRKKSVKSSKRRRGDIFA